jgi:hypothetical protein
MKQRQWTPLKESALMPDSRNISQASHNPLSRLADRLKRRSLLARLLSTLVTAPSKKCCLAQLLVIGPLGERYLTDQSWLHPLDLFRNSRGTAAGRYWMKTVWC